MFSAFLTEGAAFGVIGSLAGIGLGYAMAWSTLDLIGRTINSLYVRTSPQTIELTGGVVWAALAVGTLTAIFAAIQPAAEAARMRPDALIRPGIYQRVSGTRQNLLVGVAAGLTLAAALLTRVPPIRGVAVGGYLAVIAIVGALAVATPAVLRWTAAILKPLFHGIFAVPGLLAAASIPASLRRTAVATAALSVAVGMMVAVALMIGSFRETVAEWVAQTVQSDLWLRPSHGLENGSEAVAVFPATISADLDGLPFIAAYERFRSRNVVYHDRLVEIGSGDFEVGMRFGKLPMVSPGSSSEALRDAIRKKGVIVSESFGLKFDKGVGDQVTLPTSSGMHPFPITGVYRDYSSDRGLVVMDRALYVSMFGDDSISTIAIFLRKGTDIEAARRAIERRLGSKYRLFVLTNRNIRQEVMRIFDQTFLITYALLVVSILVAVLGIVNTLSALMLERRRELALLRVTGMTRGQLTAMSTLEATVIGIAATVLGAASGWALSWILIFVINRQSFGWTIEFAAPWSTLALLLVATFLATVLSGAVPARLVVRSDPIRHLKVE